MKTTPADYLPDSGVKLALTIRVWDKHTRTFMYVTGVEFRTGMNEMHINIDSGKSETYQEVLKSGVPLPAVFDSIPS